MAWWWLTIGAETCCGVIVGFIKIGGVKAITYVVQIAFCSYVLHYSSNLDKFRQEISDRITEALTVSWKPTQLNLSVFIVLSGWTWYKRSAHNTVEHLGVSWEQVQRRPRFLHDSKSNCVYTCTHKRYDILKVRNALIKAMSCSRPILFAVLFSRTSSIVTTTGHWLGPLRKRMCIFKFVWHTEGVS